jgi:hypothetical protein
VLPGVQRLVHPPTRPIDLPVHLAPDRRQLSLDHVQHPPTLVDLHVDHRRAPEQPAVRHLSTRLRIERRPIEHHRRALGNLAVLDHASLERREERVLPLQPPGPAHGATSLPLPMLWVNARAIP